MTEPIVDLICFQHPDQQHMRESLRAGLPYPFGRIRSSKGL